MSKDVVKTWFLTYAKQDTQEHFDKVFIEIVGHISPELARVATAGSALLSDYDTP